MSSGNSEQVVDAQERVERTGIDATAADAVGTIEHGLVIGGVTARALVEEYGSPLYVYDAGVIERQYKRLAAAFSDVKVRLLYAMKANSNVNIIRLLHGLGAGVDAVSSYEVETALRCGVPPEDILYTPNCVSFEEIEGVVDKGILVNIDNLNVLEQFGQKYGDRPCAIRINPHILAGGNAHIQTGHIDSKFGISIHQIRHVLRIVNGYGMRIEGLHMHTGSDILDAETFITGAEVLFDLAADFPDLQFIDFGSGFKVPYRPDDISTDVEALGEKLTKRFKAFCSEYGRELKLWFEPGKFFVSESGTLLTTVTTIKQTPSCVFLGTDSGMHQLLRPMLYDSYHTIENADRTEGNHRIYTVVGCICETDTFGADRRIVEAQEGDILAIRNAGAYGFAMASTYNSRPRPAEALVREGRSRLIRRRESVDDILAMQVMEG